MVKCSKAEMRRLRSALRWKKIPAAQRQRIQMVLLRESGMTQPAIAAAMGISLSTVNRAHMAYDHGGVKALKPRPNGGRKHENMTLAEEKALLARFAKAAGVGEMLNSQGGLRESDRAPNQRQHGLQPAAPARLA
jgi:Winged helix-turn helix